MLLEQFLVLVSTYYVDILHIYVHTCILRTYGEHVLSGRREDINKLKGNKDYKLNDMLIYRVSHYV